MALSSCNNFSFVNPPLPNQYEVDNFYQNTQEAALGLYGVYAAVRSAVFGPDWICATDLMSDDMDNLSSTISRKALNSLNFDNRNNSISNVWTNLYNVVGTANILLDKTSKLYPTKDSIAVTMMRSEAKCIRAWAYLMLVQLWGDVPLVTDPIYDFKDPKAKLERSPVSDIYAQILSDLSDASNLPETPYVYTIPGGDPPIAYPLTLCRGAVELLKAKVYLLQNDYENCAKAAKYLIDRDGKTFALAADYGVLFDCARKQDASRKKEIIWEIEANSIPGYNNSDHREFAPSSKIDQCITTGYQYFIASTSLFEAFNKQPTDKRMAAMYRIVKNTPCILKYVDCTTSDQNNGGPNVILLRYADALLIYAEALNGLGQTVNAATYINMVRNRAGLIKTQQIGTLTITTGDIKTTTTQKAMQDTIIAERRMELAHEFNRLFDLRRTGKIIPSIQKYNRDIQRYLAATGGKMTFSCDPAVTGGTGNTISLPVPFVNQIKNENSRMVLHPIPGIERTLNPNLTQNTGY